MSRDIAPVSFFNEFLPLLQHDLANERMHLDFYTFYASVCSGLHAREYRELFEELAQNELKHVCAFQDRIVGLGGELNVDRNSFQQFALPAFPAADLVLCAAAKMEEQVVFNYGNRLRELEAVEPCAAAAYLKVFYEDQLQDSYEDLERLRRYLA